MATAILASPSADDNTATRFRTVVDSELGFSPLGNPVITLHYSDGSVQTREVARLLGDGDSNTKLRKNRKRGFATRGLSLAPHKSAGIGNLCTHASPGCIASCLDHSGLGFVFEHIHTMRQCKAIVWQRARWWFKARFIREVGLAERKAHREGVDLCVRPNVFSDVAWERQFPELFQAYPRVQFYDYTKHPDRFGLLLPNYWVTFSRSETNESDALRILADCGNVAVVFAVRQEFDSDGNKIRTLPRKWRGFDVIDGDESDLRFLDSRGTKRGRVIGLHLKAASEEERRKAIESGFAVVD